MNARIFAATVFALLIMTAPARAALVDFTSTNNSGGGVYTVDGTLAPDAVAIFEYVIAPAPTPTNAPLVLMNIGTLAPASITSVPFSVGTAYRSCNFAFSPSACNSSSNSYYFPQGTNTLSPIAISPIVALSLSVIDSNHGDLTFTNDNSLAASFSAILEDAPHGVGFIQLVSANEISAVPLPAALPLFGSAVLVLAGFAWRSRKVSP